MNLNQMPYTFWSELANPVIWLFFFSTPEMFADTFYFQLSYSNQGSSPSSLLDEATLF